MEGNALLLQLIRKMRSRINALERENRALKGELRGRGQGAVPAPRLGNGAAGSLALDGDGAAASPASPRGSAAAAAPRERTDAAMTVRRYPAVSPAPAPSSTRLHWAGRKPAGSGLPEVPGSAQPPAPPAAAQPSREEEKGLEKPAASCLSHSPSSGMKLFQERVYKCQGKVKAVSFLLPMDISPFAEKQGSLKSPQNQSTKHLMTITEKDM
ncbi:putative coiled-coil domain-containing protein 195 [Hirundo rustica]|uniref:putative coiled-coil domain-containing protein 195 n=1 Tax=Hirundo rustica TaxID=43150 RepID=UPI001A945219|nr:putative coiled-coil domain-containing protein 195 [Hirundo rustica]